MVSRLLPSLSSLIMLLILLMACSGPMMATASATVPFPPMLPGETAGSVTGRVTTNASVAMGGVTVYVVNASDSGIQYLSSKTDNNGYFTFAGVNATNGSAVYRVMATALGYDNATSSAFSVSPETTATAYIMMTRNYSIVTPTPTPVPGPGDIAGTIKIENTSKGIINARVSLVKADLQYVTITSAVTDSSGRYHFSGVDYLSAPGYKLRVEKDGYNEKFTAPFLIVSGSTVTQDVSLSPSASANTTPTATAAPDTQTPTPQTSPTASPKANAGIPGFGVAAALAGMTLAYALARKK
ncbi:carboxypeptidase-like regulatory domain-containing protein [Methanocella sp. MCL-LM]|uniref:carboxypeptidase-like regulatory domain-containing protein n=1 Tax=Methanocella sp. MCL-LM TaxID=3412035 RepID=UPI003C718E96